MPAILTHDFFGKSVVDDVSSLLNFKSIAEKDAFLLGNQGPDPLFYLMIDPLMGKWKTLGDVMHDARPARLMCAMRMAADRLDGRERMIARAYVAGFSCHWLLDSAVHPLVYHWQYGLTSAGVEGLTAADGQQVHAEIERDFDEAVLFSRTGLTVERYRPYEEVLRSSNEVLAAIDKIYFYVSLWVYDHAVDPRTFSTAVREFRLIQRLFYAPGNGKLQVVGALDRALFKRNYSLFVAMAHRPRAEKVSDFDNREHAQWENPATHELSCASFEDLYALAQSRVLSTVDALLNCDVTEKSCEALTGNVNFEGAVVDPQGAFQW
jgi:hypothetical protein